MKILVIRFKNIGDVLLSSTICRSLKASFPNSHIDYLVYTPGQDLFEQSNDIDRVISLSSLERRKPLRYLKRAWQISQNRYDIIIDATSTAKTELISMLSPSAQFRIGREKKGRGFFYTHKVPELETNKIEQRIALLTPLIDAGHSISLNKDISIPLSSKERSQSFSKIVAAGVTLDRPIFALNVSSKLNHRMWNFDYMYQVAQYCIEEHNAQIILLQGMPHEQKNIYKFKQRFDQHSKAVFMVEAPGLRGMAALLSHCQLYVGNEGAPRHLAEAVGIPTVAIVSPTTCREEWLRQGDSKHQAIEWKDIDATASKSIGPHQADDPEYLQLYTLIKPNHVTPLIDDVVARHVAP